MSGFENKGREAFEKLDARVGLSRGAEPETPTDWLENAERDYAFGGYEFFGQEWGEKLLTEVRQLRVRLEESRAMRNALIRERAANAD